MLKTLVNLLALSRSSPARRDIDEQVLVSTLEHAKRGYTMAQETIKLLDTKTGIITGLSTLLSGFVIAWIKWSLESKASSPANLIQVAHSSKIFAVLLCIFLATTFSATFLCIFWSIWTVVGRSRPNNLNEKFVVLFPQYSQTQQVDACRAFERKLKGMGIREMLSEYEDQLRVVGMILGKKFTAHRRAALALILQVACILLTVLAVVLTELLAP